MQAASLVPCRLTKLLVRLVQVTAATVAERDVETDDISVDLGLEPRSKLQQPRGRQVTLGLPYATARYSG